MTTSNQSHEPERMAEQAALLPCPFCGGQAARGMFSVWCMNCNAATVEDSSATIEEIISRWSSRVNTTDNHTATFATLWSTAPRSRTARIEREDAEWWFNQNQGDKALIEQAKLVARAVEQDLDEIHRLVSGRIEE